MDDDGEMELFDAQHLTIVVAEAGEDLSTDQKRRRRQAEQLAAGVHPLTGGRLHPDAAPAGDRQAAGLRCGGCKHRQLLNHDTAKTYPKCYRGAVRDDAGRLRKGTAIVTRGAATDVPAWWSACVHWEAPDTPE
ncbi:MAG: hypothetical protein EPO06_11935 [Burkholderiaceae bacterium]|nr:MAG: hypothetical protein EPO06_11935 [Burkholderiaceae bacterium]